MADPNTPSHDPAVRTTANPDANTTTPAGTSTQAGYRAETVKTSPTGTTTTHATPDHVATGATTATTPAANSAATKGLIVGILTFLALVAFEFFDGVTPEGEAITLFDVIVYIVVGVVVGWAVKKIALRSRV